jgi:hypothetical protein
LFYYNNFPYIFFVIENISFYTYYSVKLTSYEMVCSVGHTDLYIFLYVNFGYCGSFFVKYVAVLYTTIKYGQRDLLQNATATNSVEKI